MAVEVDEAQLEEMLANAGAAGMPVVKPGEKVDMEQLKAMQQQQAQDPKEMSQGMRAGLESITEMRDEADVAKKLEIAESCKADANSQLATSPPKALKAYLVGIWLLMRSNPEPTKALVAPVATERDAKISLGAGSDSISDEEFFGESFAGQVVELRRALHLNVAAAALKLDMFAVVGDACIFVLKEQPENPKALFRLAKASDGIGDVAGAIKTLGTLLKLDGQSDNTEARKLLQALRARKSKEAKIYGGFFEKAREDGGSLYDDSKPENVEKMKAADLKNKPGEQDASIVEDILKNRMICLPQSNQAELEKMSKVGIAPTEVLKAYRRFLIAELKNMAKHTVPEELKEIMSVMQATESKMEETIASVKFQIAVRKRAEAAAEAGPVIEEVVEEVAAPVAKESPVKTGKTAKKAAIAAEKAAAEKAAATKAAAEKATAEKAATVKAAAAKATAEKATADKAAAAKATAEKATADKAAGAKATAEKAAAEKAAAAKATAEKAAAEKAVAEKAAAEKAAAEKVVAAKATAEKAAAEKAAAEKAAAEAKEKSAAEKAALDAKEAPVAALKIAPEEAKAVVAPAADVGLLGRLAGSVCSICSR